MDQHEVVAARFQDGPLNELYAIVGRNNREREALTEWIIKHVHYMHVICQGRVTSSTSTVGGNNSTIQWGFSHDRNMTEMSFYTIKL